MSRIEKPWGYEEQVTMAQVDIGDKAGMLGVRKLVINAEEMTSYAHHSEQSDIIYLEKGDVAVRKNGDIKELEKGNAMIIRSGENHQIQNIGGDVAEVLEISFPYKPDDIERVEDPYEKER